jgi:iron complex outermembrane recepter protein
VASTSRPPAQRLAIIAKAASCDADMEFASWRAANYCYISAVASEHGGSTIQMTPQSGVGQWGKTNVSPFFHRRSSALALTIAALCAGPVHAQETTQAAGAVNAPAGDDSGLEEVVVTGFRGSVNAAQDEKRAASGVVDVIKAEDIADFPDNNLAESIQRVPGVAISRDGGEGRALSVRGLGPDFTRVRINGMEAVATTGGADANGGVNRGRGFDFNVFASELFNSITVRKTASADVEEGSLGATVDLQTARPLDFTDPLVIAGSAQGGYNDLSEKTNPRLAGLLSWQNAESTLGALVSVAWSERDVLEEGHSSVRWGPSGANGGFNAASTLPGYTIGQVNTAPTGDGSNWDQLLYHPRIPRYDNWQYEIERLGMTGSVQWRASDRAMLTIDALYSDSDTTRAENYIEALSFSRTGSAGGKPFTIIRDGAVNDQNELVYGVFDDVDMRIESRYDELETVFQQYTAAFEYQFTDSFKTTAFAGHSKSEFSNPVQTTITLDRANSDGYSWDYRANSREPVVDLGFDPSDPAAWSMTNGVSDVRLRRHFANNEFTSTKLVADWTLAPELRLSFGGEARQFEYDSREYRRNVAETQVPTLTAAQLRDVTTSLSALTGDPSYGNYIIPNYDAMVSQLNLYCDCVTTFNGQTIDLRMFGIENATARSNWATVKEDAYAGFVQANFELPIGPITLRGDVGLRYARTEQDTLGYAAITNPDGTVDISPLRVEREYGNWLPSLNLAAELSEDWVLRFGAAKVITRPTLASLSPGGSLTILPSNRVYNTGNPFLDPTKATNLDLAVEWYFAPGSMLSVGVFQKDISTLSGTNIADSVPFSSLGLPLSLLDGTNVQPSDLFEYRRVINGDGGEINGFELNYQHQLRFLPSFLSNLGVLANYTYVDADIEYPGPGGGAPVSGPLTNLSKDSANGTLFYEDDRLSLRASVSYRSGYVTAFAGGARESSSEEGVNSNLQVDASASYKVTDALSLTLEGLNLTDEYQDFYIDADDRVVLYHNTGRQYYFGARVRF